MRYLKVIASLIIMVFGVFTVCWYFSPNPNEASDNTPSVELDEINNRRGFLLSKAFIDTTWFELRDVVLKSIYKNESVNFRMSRYDHNNRLVLTKGLKVVMKKNCGELFTLDSEFDLSYRQLEELLTTGNAIKIGFVMPREYFEAGRYRFAIQVSGTFDSQEYSRSGKPMVLEVSVSNHQAASFIVTMVILALIIIALCCWFLILKPEFYPTFKAGGKLQVNTPEVINIFIQKNARKLIIGKSIEHSDNFISRLFKGPVQRILPNTNHSVTIEPTKSVRKRKILYRMRTSGKSSDVSINFDAHLKHLNHYNIQTGTEYLKFQYFNLKHQ